MQAEGKSGDKAWAERLCGEAAMAGELQAGEEWQPGEVIGSVVGCCGQSDALQAQVAQGGCCADGACTSTAEPSASTGTNVEHACLPLRVCTMSTGSTGTAGACVAAAW